MRSAKIFIFCTSFLLIVSCSSVGTPTAVKTAPAQAPTAAKSTQPGYPAPVEGSSTLANYPPPAGPQNIPTITVVASLGQVSGKILLRGNPVGGRNIYVCPIIKSPEGTKVAVRFDPSSFYNATIDENGYFHVVNIPAGDYGLIYDTGMDSALLSDPKTQNQILFEIKENTRIDLGTLDFDALPLP